MVGTEDAEGTNARRHGGNIQKPCTGGHHAFAITLVPAHEDPVRGESNGQQASKVSSNVAHTVTLRADTP